MPGDEHASQLRLVRGHQIEVIRQPRTRSQLSLRSSEPRCYRAVGQSRSTPVLWAVPHHVHAHLSGRGNNYASASYRRNELELPMSNEREQRLNEIITRYLEGVQAGQPPNKEETISRNADLAKELTSFF